MKSLCNSCKHCDKKNMMLCAKSGLSKIDNEVRVCQNYKQELRKGIK